MISTDGTAHDPRVPTRVLLVEDNFFAAIDVQRRLEAMGCHVLGPVPSVREGLALASTETMSGAILDINIIGGSSAVIAEELLRRDIPFFFITGYASPSGLPPALKARPRLNKPVEDRVLEATVNRVFARRSA